MTDSTIRRLKWVGDPAMLLADRRTVANWKWENRRAVASPGSIRTCSPPTPKKGGFPGLSKTYVFGRGPNKRAKPTSRDFIQNVDSIDADIIMRLAPDEFIDVTDSDHPELVVNEPYILKRSAADGKYYKYRKSA